MLTTFQVNEVNLDCVTHEFAVGALKETKERVKLVIAKPTYINDNSVQCKYTLYTLVKNLVWSNMIFPCTTLYTGVYRNFMLMFRVERLDTDEIKCSASFLQDFCHSLLLYWVEHLSCHCPCNSLHFCQI